MEFKQIENTCSMVEMGYVQDKEMENITKNDFKECLNNGSYNNEYSSPSTKVILYNTNSTKTSKEHKNLLKLGFKPVFTYKGNADNKTVTSYMLDLKKNKYK